MMFNEGKLIGKHVEGNGHLKHCAGRENKTCNRHQNSPSLCRNSKPGPTKYEEFYRDVQLKIITENLYRNTSKDEWNRR